MSVNLDGLDFGGGAVEAIGREEIMAVLGEVLRFRELPVVAVSVSALGRRLDKWVYGRGLQAEQVAADSRDGEQVAAGNGQVREEEPAKDSQGREEEEGLSPIGRKLLTLWRDFFGNQAISPDDNFFEIGGDSLKLLSMIHRTQKDIGIKLTVRDFFNKSTVRELSKP
jgi:acyl carrier protein